MQCIQSAQATGQPKHIVLNSFITFYILIRKVNLEKKRSPNPEKEIAIFNAEIIELGTLFT